jgi:hypothetical protein
MFLFSYSVSSVVVTSSLALTAGLCCLSNTVFMAQHMNKKANTKAQIVTTMIQKSWSSCFDIVFLLLGLFLDENVLDATVVDVITRLALVGALVVAHMIIIGQEQATLASARTRLVTH